MTFRKVIRFWSLKKRFRLEFSRLLATAPFEAFRWETPPVSAESLDRPFRFVIVKDHGLVGRKTEPGVFLNQFNGASSNASVIHFPNLSGDAVLIVPRPMNQNENYGHLASFLRHGVPTQIDLMWQTTGLVLEQELNQKPIWLNTAGGGVAWLHIRLDSQPKYYRHTDYRSYF